jgi:5'-3' exonuclease
LEADIHSLNRLCEIYSGERAQFEEVERKLREQIRELEERNMYTELHQQIKEQKELIDQLKKDSTGMMNRLF